MRNNKKIGVLGYGEVGKAIASLYDNPEIQDLTGPGFPVDAKFDILHICIPYNEKFDEAVKFPIKRYAEGGIVMVHSTVPPGTTAKIGGYHKFVVHAPIRGVHPNLEKGVRTFPMFIGADFAGVGQLAADHMESLGVKTIVLYKTASSELLKLLDMTYYGVAIAFHAYAKGLCDELGVSFDMVMGEANKSYNAGYTELGKPNVVRPVLTAPEGGKIGGHCVVPNAQILQEVFGADPLLEAILRHK